jgi:hypothetical protein
LDAKDSPKCPGCDAAVDEWGDHLLCCLRNNYSERHNAPQDKLFEILRTSGQGVTKEVQIPNQPDQHLRPADLLLSAWNNGQPTALDLTIVHSWQNANRQSKEKWKLFLKQKEKQKHDKYDEPCQKAGWSFTTAAFGTWGGWGPEGAKNIKRILQRAASWQEGEQRQSKANELQEQLSISLTRQIAKILATKARIP